MLFNNITPLLQTPFTDFLGSISHHQRYGRCADFEMKMMNCLEAYGAQRGEEDKCKDIIEDFMECHTLKKQGKRLEAMRIERHRQWLKGERSSEDHYAPPPKVDSF
uniref:Complex I-15 kDa n=1 Tax=Clastoptera arizonana TaxID=38151 RepID=A0A1B6DI93_9HEMI